jgi:ELWxxDGT repeat protein
LVKNGLGDSDLTFDPLKAKLKKAQCMERNMNSISKLSVIMLIVFFLFLNFGCSDEDDGSISVATTIDDTTTDTTSDVTPDATSDATTDTEDPSPVQATALSFEDFDFDEDQISGSLQITSATDETYVDEYRLYWGSSATSKLTMITSYTADGSNPNPSHSFAADTAVPENATHLLVYSVYTDSATSTVFESSPTSLDIPDACIVLVKDIRDGTFASLPDAFTPMDGVLYFTAADSSGNTELWKSDGTAIGTVMVKDINTSGNSNPKSLTAVNGTLYFGAVDNAGNQELWKSDGTIAGTVKVTNFGGGENSYYFSDITEMNGEIFFPMEMNSGTELWKSNGTVDNKTQVTWIEPMSQHAFEYSNLVIMNNKLFFNANDESNGSNKELWSSNGDASQDLVEDIDANPNVSSNPGALTVINGTLFFSADGNSVSPNRELWKSDGTPAGTVLVKDIDSNNTTSGNPNSLTAIGNSLYFTANDGVHGTELWISDGTLANTKMVSDINPAGDNSIYGMTEYKGEIYFSAKDNASNSNELWKTDGTEAGTDLVKDIYEGTVDGGSPTYLTVFSDYLYFFASNATNNRELWRTDGTESGTIPVSDFPNGNICSECRLKAAGDKLFIRGTDGSTGDELFMFYYK